MRLILIVLIIGSLNWPHSLAAQSLQAKIDSTTALQFHEDIADFLKRADKLKSRAAKFLSLKKEDYTQVILGIRKDFPSSREGKQLLLDYYAETAHVLKLLYNLEHVKMSEEKKRTEYRNLLAEYLQVTSSLVSKIGTAYEISNILEKTIERKAEIQKTLTTSP